MQQHYFFLKLLFILLIKLLIFLQVIMFKIRIFYNILIFIFKFINWYIIKKKKKNQNY